MTRLLIAIFGLGASGCLSVSEPCTVEKHADGSATMTCPDGTVQTIEPGQDGADGEEGHDGQDGQDGQSHDDGHDALIQVDDCDDSEVACPECPDGGYRIQVGHDENGDGELQANEVDHTYFVCQPQDEGGLGGGTPVLEVSEDPPPASECPNGGTTILSGYDTTGDGEIDELLDTLYVCEGDDADVSYLVEVATELPGENCPEGGYAVHTGPDENGDGEIDQITDTMYVCHQSTSFAPEWGDWYVTDWAPADCWMVGPWFELAPDADLELQLGGYDFDGGGPVPMTHTLTTCALVGDGGKELDCAPGTVPNEGQVEVSGTFLSTTELLLTVDVEDQDPCDLQVEHFEFTPESGQWVPVDMEGDCPSDDVELAFEHMGLRLYGGYVYSEQDSLAGPFGICTLAGRHLGCWPFLVPWGEGAIGEFLDPETMELTVPNPDESTCDMTLAYQETPVWGRWDPVNWTPSGCTDDDDWWVLDEDADGRIELWRAEQGSEPPELVSICDVDGKTLVDCEPLDVGGEDITFSGDFGSETLLELEQSGAADCEVTLERRAEPAGPWDVVGANYDGCFVEGQWFEVVEDADGRFEIWNAPPGLEPFQWTTCDLRGTQLEGCEPTADQEFWGTFPSRDHFSFAHHPDGEPEACALELVPRNPAIHALTGKDEVILDEDVDEDVVRSFASHSSAAVVWQDGAAFPLTMFAGDAMTNSFGCMSMVRVNLVSGMGSIDTGDSSCTYLMDDVEDAWVEFSGRVELDLTNPHDMYFNDVTFRIEPEDPICDDIVVHVDGRLGIFGEGEPLDFDGFDAQAFDTQAVVTSNIGMEHLAGSLPECPEESETVIFDYGGPLPADLEMPDGGLPEIEEPWNGVGTVGLPGLGKVQAQTEGQVIGDTFCGGWGRRAEEGTTLLEGAQDGEVLLDYTLPDQDACEGIEWELNGEPQGTLSGVFCSVIPVAATGWLTLLAMGIGLGRTRRRVSSGGGDLE